MQIIIGPVPGFVFCCHCLQILNNILNGDPANYVDNVLLCF
jgi:hypothetical protein